MHMMLWGSLEVCWLLGTRDIFQCKDFHSMGGILLEMMAVGYSHTQYFLNIYAPYVNREA